MQNDPSKSRHSGHTHKPDQIRTVLGTPPTAPVNDSTNYKNTQFVELRASSCQQGLRSSLSDRPHISNVHSRHETRDRPPTRQSGLLQNRCSIQIKQGTIAIKLLVIMNDVKLPFAEQKTVRVQGPTHECVAHVVVHLGCNDHPNQGEHRAIVAIERIACHVMEES